MSLCTRIRMPKTSCFEHPPDCEGTVSRGRRQRKTCDDKKEFGPSVLEKFARGKNDHLLQVESCVDRHWAKLAKVNHQKHLPALQRRVAQLGFKVARHQPDFSERSHCQDGNRMLGSRTWTCGQRFHGFVTLRSWAESSREPVFH